MFHKITIGPNIWTRFSELWPNGNRQTPFDYIYIEANVEDAKKVFKALFNIDPAQAPANYRYRGAFLSLEQATAHYRGCSQVPPESGDIFVTYDEDTARESLDEYLSHANVRVVRADEIRNLGFEHA